MEAAGNSPADWVMDRLREQRVSPLFTCDQLSLAVEVLGAIHAGGMRVAEFTNRTRSGLEVFQDLVAAAAEKFPDLTLGAGTITSPAQAESFLDAGARFLVAPSLDLRVGGP